MLGANADTRVDEKVVRGKRPSLRGVVLTCMELMAA